MNIKDIIYYNCGTCWLLHRKITKLERAEQQVTEILDSEIEVTLLWIRAEYIEGAGKKYFANLEKRAKLKVTWSLNTDFDTVNKKHT